MRDYRIRRLSDTGNIEIVDGRSRMLARSRNRQLLIYDSTALVDAVDIAKRFGKRFSTVIYGNWPAWFPHQERNAGWMN